MLVTPTWFNATLGIKRTVGFWPVAPSRRTSRQTNSPATHLQSCNTFFQKNVSSPFVWVVSMRTNNRDFLSYQSIDHGKRVLHSSSISINSLCLPSLPLCSSLSLIPLFIAATLISFYRILIPQANTPPHFQTEEWKQTPAHKMQTCSQWNV